MRLIPPYRLIVTDIDGTLLDDEGGLPALNREALIHCLESGVSTCFATGRRWTTCRKLIERLSLHDLVGYCILNNGMLVLETSTGRTLFRQDFPMDLVLEVAARLNALSLDPVALGHNPDGKTHDVFWRRDSLMNSDFIAKNPDHSRQVKDWRELDGIPVMELVLVGPKAALVEAARGLASLGLEIAIIRNTFYREYMLEITPESISKLSGTRQLLSHLGLEAEHMIAIGDSENDYAMLKGSPLSIAVANADPRIRAAAKEMTGTNSAGGFGQAVFRHLPRNAIPKGEGHVD